MRRPTLINRINFAAAFLGLCVVVTMTLTFVTLVGAAFLTYDKFIDASPPAPITTGGSMQATDPLRVRAKLRERALFYETLIASDYLHKGMVVNRDDQGEPLDLCDSLLFSSLRYASLVRLGLDGAAEKAWRKIELSESPSTPGLWHRHPECRWHPSSRDMILGLLVALSREDTPRRGEHLERLTALIEERRGYVGDGPFHVSLASTGLLELLRLTRGSLTPQPASSRFVQRRAFSSAELGALFSPRGYRSHLLALSIWLELDLKARGHDSARSVAAVLSPLATLSGVNDLRASRLRWLAVRLEQKDPTNMFFRWLRLKAEGALDKETTTSLIVELMTMPQFPTDRLPNECDRFADYLWQRDSVEHHQKASHCRRHFNGVDFLWMASLLLEG